MATTKKQVAIAVLSLLAVLVLVLVVVGTYGYQRYYAPVMRPLMLVTAAGRLEQSVPNAAAFQAPPSGAITPEQWTRYCDIEAAVQGVLGEATGVVAKQRDAVRAAAKGSPETVSFKEGIAAFREIGTVYLKAKQAQVEAVTRAGFSFDEYRWVRRQALLGAGLALAELDLAGLRTAPQDRRERVDVKAIAADTAAVSANGALVSNRRADLDTWLAMAFFDL